METVKIGLLVGAIAAALAALGFGIYRSNSSSGAVPSGPIQHVTAAARSGRAAGSEQGGARGDHQSHQAPGGARGRGRPLPQPGPGP